MSFWTDRRVLVTGGAGFIGSNLARRLVEVGARVRVVDNLERGTLKNLARCIDSIEFLQMDLTNKQACRDACNGMEVVFHLASKVSTISYYLKRPAEVMSQMLLMDVLMWQAAKECGVSRYLYTSSALVYPEELQAAPDAPPMKEEDALPAHPSVSYGWAKLLGERLLEYDIAEGSSLRVAIPRLIGVYGENQYIDLEKGSATAVFIRRAIEYPERKPFILLGSGKETRAFCYVGDILDAFLLLVEKLDSRRIIGPLNIGSADRVTINDLAQQIIAISGKPIEIVHDLSHPTTIWGQALDCSRAAEMLDGWRPRISLAQGLERTYRHIEERLKKSRTGG
jgi:nucleoside-diphosphate-sugar epimerase